MLDFTPESRKTDVKVAVEFLTGVLKRRCTAFLMSDFCVRDDFTNALTICNRKHDVVAVQVYDRRAESLPNVGLMKVLDAETGHEMYIDTSDKRLRRAHKEHWQNGRPCWPIHLTKAMLIMCQSPLTKTMSGL